MLQYFLDVFVISRVCCKVTLRLAWDMWHVARKQLISEFARFLRRWQNVIGSVNRWCYFYDMVEILPGNWKELRFLTHNGEMSPWPGKKNVIVGIWHKYFYFVITEMLFGPHVVYPLHCFKSYLDHMAETPSLCCKRNYILATCYVCSRRVAKEMWFLPLSAGSFRVSHCDKFKHRLSYYWILRICSVLTRALYQTSFADGLHVLMTLSSECAPERDSISCKWNSVLITLLVRYSLLTVLYCNFCSGSTYLVMSPPGLWGLLSNANASWLVSI